MRKLTFLYISSKGLAACGSEVRAITKAPRDMSRRDRGMWTKQRIKNDEETVIGTEEPLNGKEECDHRGTSPTASATEVLQA